MSWLTTRIEDLKAPLRRHPARRSVLLTALELEAYWRRRCLRAEIAPRSGDERLAAALERLRRQYRVLQEQHSRLLTLVRAELPIIDARLRLEQERHR